MKEIIAYTMSNTTLQTISNEITCVPYQSNYWDAYKRIYNECFYEMRKDLEVEPFNFYSEESQLEGKTDHIFLYIQNNSIIGSISCYDNKIDDFIINKSYQKNGYGAKLLNWAMNHIKAQNYNEIILNVAEWNKPAIRLYQAHGFEIIKTERVR